MRIVLAGAGTMGAQIAYHLALAGAEDVVLADPGEVAAGSTSRAMGGIRQQFETTEDGAAAPADRRGRIRELGVPVEDAALPEGVHGGDVRAAITCRRDGLASPPGVAREVVRRAAELGVDVREGTLERFAGEELFPETPVL
jgi:glycine/D-amino acid oxidase-like deaminating enzyme